MTDDEIINEIGIAVQRKKFALGGDRTGVDKQATLTPDGLAAVKNRPMILIGG